MKGKADLPHKTAEEIVAKVHHLLTSSEGQQRISTLQHIVRTLLLHASNVRTSLKLVRSRSTASFYTRASKASAAPPTLSVRVGGVECGELLLLSGGPTGKKQRRFTATNPNRFSRRGKILESGLDWADRTVREYLVCTAAIVRNPSVEKSLANRESVIEADLIRAMMKRRPADGQDALAYQSASPLSL